MTQIVEFRSHVSHENLALDGWTELNTIMGASLKSEFPATTFVIEEGQEVPDFFKSAGAPITSPKGKGLLEKNSVNAEFLPITLEFEEDAKVTSHYFLVNVLDIVDCVDWRNSTIVMDSRYPIIRKVDSLVLRAAEAPLFRPKGLEFLLCCSESLVRALAAERVSGLGFCRVDTYTFPPA
jgi:hypothetical protein